MKLTRKLFVLIFAGLQTTACVDGNREVTIFSIPNHTTPSDLEENGFQIYRNKDEFFDTPGRMKGDVEFCELDLVYARVDASYQDADTTKIKHYAINIDFKPFEEMTGLKAKDYSSVEIDGYKYKVKVNEDMMSLHLTRLGL